MNEIALEALRNRITAVFPEQIRAALGELTDEQIWWRPNEQSNSVGNLVLHLSGSLNHFLNRGIGGFEYERDRPGEFAERRTIPKAELLEIFDNMVAQAEQTFAALAPSRLNDPSPEPKKYAILFEDLFSVATHIAFHAGQIVWIAKMYRQDAMGELWMDTHKQLGAWKRRE